MRSVLFALAVLVALAAFVPVSGRVDGQSVFGSIAGPTALAPRPSATDHATILGGPGGPPAHGPLPPRAQRGGAIFRRRGARGGALRRAPQGVPRADREHEVPAGRDRRG